MAGNDSTDAYTIESTAEYYGKALMDKANHMARLQAQALLSEIRTHIPSIEPFDDILSAEVPEQGALPTICIDLQEYMDYVYRAEIHNATGLDMGAWL